MDVHSTAFLTQRNTFFELIYTYVGFLDTYLIFCIIITRYTQYFL